jgi:hypothetical protein
MMAYPISFGITMILIGTALIIRRPARRRQTELKQV